MDSLFEREEEFLTDNEKLNRIRENKKRIENTFLALYRADIFQHRLNYKAFFARELVQLWELYISEVQIALSFLEEHEKKFLEDCYQNKLNRKEYVFF